MHVLLMRPVDNEGSYFRPSGDFLRQTAAQIKDRFIGKWFRADEAMRVLETGKLVSGIKTNDSFSRVE